MKKYILSAFAAIALAFTASAADYDYTLLVNTKEGNVVEFEFKYYPVATFEGDEVVITDDHNLEAMRYDMADIANFTFKKTVSGIDEVTPDSAVKVRITKEYMKVSGLKAGAVVNIHDIAGAKVAGGTADADGNVHIALEGLGSGVFVASMPGTTFKFIR
ncbi:MAG: hypothetical protein NC548_57830 [Lachnospiraceae bacterium]|nr:hypothetical protein [Prevotella sp.]MCM1075153.1 hypothetical protein [Ruminococcus sp.]MCM1224150.1 hypothetical protein [Lachnospiraceae bacterium]